MHNLKKAFKNSSLFNDDTKLLNIFSENHKKIEAYVNIYKNNFYENLTNTLTIVYPTVKKLIGENYFENLCKLYIKNNLPKKNNLVNYGENFASYIKSIQWLKNLYYLPDIAKLDYCMNKVYNSNKPYKIEIRKDNVDYFDDFKIKNYIRFCKSNYPVDFIYKLCNAKTQNSTLIKLPQRESRLVVFKQNYMVRYIRLTSFEYDFLFNFKKHKKLSNIQYKYDLEDDMRVQKILLKTLRLKLLTY